MSRLSRVIPIVGGAVAGGAIALVVASGGGGTSNVTTQTITQPASSAAVPTALSTSHGLTINQIYRAASPGVVDITVSTSQTSGGGFFGGSGGQQQETGEGAGVVYDTKGNILTDQHVVANASSVKVHFQNGPPPTRRCSAPTRRPTSP